MKPLRTGERGHNWFFLSKKSAKKNRKRTYFFPKKKNKSRKRGVGIEEEKKQLAFELTQAWEKVKAQSASSAW